MGYWTKACLLAIALATPAAMGQEPTPDVVQIVTDEVPLASSELRSIAVAHRADRDHDQYLTQDEIYIAIREAEGDAITKLSSASSRLESRALHSIRQIGIEGLAQDLSDKCRRMLMLVAALGELLSSGVFEVSLVDNDFHRLVTHLPPEQRHALLEADVAGNNDGSITAQEFYEHNRRRLSRQTRFEADFGEDAYLAVSSLLDSRPAR